MAHFGYSEDMKDEEILEYVGLTENEARVYIALLELGEASVQEIAVKASIKRTTLYMLLDELRKKGAILVLPHSKKAMYRAKSPKDLYDRHIENLQKVAQIIPTLQALQKKESRSNTLYFEGAKGIEEALYYRHDELANTTMDSFWAKVNLWDPKTEKAVYKWAKKTGDMGITTRAIASDHPSLTESRKLDEELGGREVLILPSEKYAPNTSIEATDLFVRIIQYDTPQAIVIESSDIVKTVRQIFELVWNAQIEKV